MAYQVLARKYRPKTFAEVVGQDTVVTTLKNGIKNKRLAHAYLFCGSRGTGKTTLARVFAKALNCLQPTTDGEPCTTCSSCKEIASGHSLDVLEIDGASHRGIDDIRQINETVGYATSTGGYKIYIIDEVHMLTKEAFNALLKTLEEPPPRVLFFFATTEPHKVLPTILSRCQRFNLSRIPTELIIAKLSSICRDLQVEIAEEAAALIANRAEGGLRDAESLLDQIIAFHAGAITTESVNAVLGIMPRDTLFELDKAGKAGNLGVAFEIAHQVYAQGKDIVHFVETLTEHIRTLLLIKVGGKDAPYLQLTPAGKEKYEASSRLYTQEQCLTLLEYLSQAQHQIRFATAGKIALENILLHVLRSHQRIPVEYLVRRLAELEKTVAGASQGTENAPPPPPVAPVAAAPKPAPKTVESPPPSPKPAAKTAPTPSVSIDPTPTPSDLGIKAIKSSTAVTKPAISATPSPKPNLQNQHKHDTLMQFAAVELEGTLQRKKLNT